MKKRTRLFVMLLCCIMVFGLFSITAEAAASDPQQPFSFEVDKYIEQGGSLVPGAETFTFELEYGIIELTPNNCMFTPDNTKSLADRGIVFTNNTITTKGGTGQETFTLGGTIDLTKVNEDNGWQTSTGNDGVTKTIITLILTEKNDGKTGWTYSDAERALTITVKGNEVWCDVTMLASDASDNNFTNTYTAYELSVKKTDADGKALAGATFSLTGTGNSQGVNLEAVSGDDGIATFVLPAGYFTLAEKTAPKGYIKSDKTYEIAVCDGVVCFYNEDAKDDEMYTEYEQVTFINKVDTPVPETDDSSNMLLWTSLLMAGGLGLLAIKRREDAE